MIGTKPILVQPSLVEVTCWVSWSEGSQGVSCQGGACPPPWEPAAGRWWCEVVGKSCGRKAQAEDRISMTCHCSVVFGSPCIYRGNNRAPASGLARCLAKLALLGRMLVCAGQVRASSGAGDQGNSLSLYGEDGEKPRPGRAWRW